MRQRRGTSAAALLLVVCACTAMGKETASAAPDPGCDASRLGDGHSVEDVDTDAFSDVVVGVPRSPADGLVRSGVVDVHHPNTPTPSQRLGESFLGQTPAVGDEFGAAVAYTDVDETAGYLGQGCEDLLIGAPGAASGRGRVTVARGSNDGILPEPAVTLTGRNAGDRFGSSIAVQDRDVWVGAPDQTVRGRVGAGAVYHYRVTGNGSLTFVQAISENTPGIPGTAEVGDHFGQVLCASLDRLVVGQPDEDAGRVRDAGAVTLVSVTSQHGALVAARKVSENTRGVPGVATAGDGFGASVALAGTLVVGVPGADLRGRRDAGAVQIFDVAGGQVVRMDPAARVSQESPTIPGASEVGDRFGASVLLGNTSCLWIGVPGEGLGGAAATGEVIRTHAGFGADPTRVRAFGTVIRLGGRGTDNLPGAPQRGSHVGAALAAETPDNEGMGGRSGGETVVVSVPGYNGSDVGSGEVWISHSTPTVRLGDADTVVDASGVYADSGGERPHEHYGTPATARTNGANGGV